MPRSTQNRKMRVLAPCRGSLAITRAESEIVADAVTLRRHPPLRAERAYPPFCTAVRLA
jgi:hypothetical protein